MKKILFTALLIAGALAAQAQNAEVDNAEKMVLLGQIDKAKESIDKAVLHPKTANVAKTYLIKSKVYGAIAQGDKDGTDLGYDPIAVAYEALEKAKELDTKKQLDAADLKDADFAIYAASYNKGIAANNKEDYKGALESFSFASKLNPQDTALYLNIGIMAEKLQDTKTAMNAYNELANMNYDKDAYIYRQLAELNKAAGNKTAQVAAIEKGRKLFPTDNSLIVDEINYYLGEGKPEVVLNKLKDGVAADPKNKTLYFTLGVTYENVKDPANAEDAYKKALAIDSEYFDANFNLGALYYNQAAEIIKAANDLPTSKSKEYAAELERFKVQAGVALPYLEKAYAENPKDRNVIISLKELYARTNQTDKYAKVDAELKAMDNN